MRDYNSYGKLSGEDMSVILELAYQHLMNSDTRTAVGELLDVSDDWLEEIYQKLRTELCELSDTIMEQDDEIQ